ncbi:hypothetical protein [Lentzea sp. NPDC051838]|uniref:hypothetical protein n=1 Tax=Lentzea sp. NPDC051838 TaxID=3154849 RepID=UPI00341BD416
MQGVLALTVCGNTLPVACRHVGGTNIYVRKTDGPEIDVKWRRCAGGAEGSAVRLQNADPTPYVRIDTNFRASTVFCLSAKSYGSNTTDTWNGTVKWNVS